MLSIRRLHARRIRDKNNLKEDPNACNLKLVLRPRDANNLREFSLNRQNSPDVDIKINMAFYSFVDQQISHLANFQLLKMFLHTNKVRIVLGRRRGYGYFLRSYFEYSRFAKWRQFSGQNRSKMLERLAAGWANIVDICSKIIFLGTARLRTDSDQETRTNEKIHTDGKSSRKICDLHAL